MGHQCMSSCGLFPGTSVDLGSLEGKEQHKVKLPLRLSLLWPLIPTNLLPLISHLSEADPIYFKQQSTHTVHPAFTQPLVCLSQSLKMKS